MICWTYLPVAIELLEYRDSVAGRSLAESKRWPCPLDTYVVCEVHAGKLRHLRGEGRRRRSYSRGLESMAMPHKHEQLRSR